MRPLMHLTSSIECCTDAMQAMARLWRVAHFVLTDFLELSLEEMPANLTTYPAGIPATAPSALTASMHLGILPELVTPNLSSQ